METERSTSPLAATDEQPTRQQDSQAEEGEGTAEDNRKTDKETASLDREEIVKALEVVETDSVAIARSFTSLFASLRLALSQASSNSVDHMSCFSDAAGRLQECALDAATKGNRYISSCLRLNEEMKGIENLAMQLKILRRNVDALDSAVNRLVRLP